VAERVESNLAGVLPLVAGGLPCGDFDGRVVNTDRTEFCPAVSPDGRCLHFTSDRSFADKSAERARSTRQCNARLDGPGNGLGDGWRVPMSAVFEALGRTPR